MAAKKEESPVHYPIEPSKEKAENEKPETKPADEEGRGGSTGGGGGG